MKDYAVTKHNLDELMSDIKKELEESALVIVTTQQGGTGKWGLARLWRAWMASTADFMANNGVTMPLMLDVNGEAYGKRPFNADDAHELFSRKHSGVDEHGNRLSWAKNGNQRKATKGERFNALQRHEAWASERGIMLYKPRGSEYEKLEQEQSQ